MLVVALSTPGCLGLSPALGITCRVGIPCGDTCIASGETCHVGGGRSSGGSSLSDEAWAAILVGGILVTMGLIYVFYSIPRWAGWNTTPSPP